MNGRWGLTTKRSECSVLNCLEAAEGYSSIGRASVSKTEGCRFDSYCPCHLSGADPEPVRVTGFTVC